MLWFTFPGHCWNQCDMQVVSNTNIDHLNKVTTPKRTFYLTGETTEIVDSWLRGNNLMFCVLCIYCDSRLNLNAFICLSFFLLTMRLSSDCLFLHSFVHPLAHALNSYFYYFLTLCQSLTSFPCPHVLWVKSFYLSCLLYPYFHLFVVSFVCPLYNVLFDFLLMWLISQSTNTMHKYMNHCTYMYNLLCDKQTC